jgi:hypothetical protein
MWEEQKKWLNNRCLSLRQRYFKDSPFGFQFAYKANLVSVFVAIFSSLPLPKY